MSSGPDWGIGSYETTAAPALVAPAEHLIQLAAPEPAERALDLGCGSGNATLPLLESGAAVTAIDPSPRLVCLTSERAHAAGHQLTTAVAGAEAIPLPDGDMGLIVSNFAVIFCPDPAAAFAEIIRVLAPGGRLLYSAWLPVGPISQVSALMRAAAQSTGAAAVPAPERVDAPADASRAPIWHDPATLADLIPGGADAITTHHGEVIFTAASPRAWLQTMQDGHPAWLAVRDLVSEATWASVIAQSAELLAPATAPDGTAAIRSEYVVIEVRPQC